MPSGRSPGVSTVPVKSATSESEPQREAEIKSPAVGQEARCFDESLLESKLSELWRFHMSRGASHKPRSGEQKQKHYRAHCGWHPRARAFLLRARTDRRNCGRTARLPQDVQLKGKIPRRLEAQQRIFLQAMTNDVIERQ